jgi:hypothetical protein
MASETSQNRTSFSFLVRLSVRARIEVATSISLIADGRQDFLIPRAGNQLLLSRAVPQDWQPLAAVRAAGANQLTVSERTACYYAAERERGKGLTVWADKFYREECQRSHRSMTPVTAFVPGLAHDEPFIVGSSGPKRQAVGTVPHFQRTDHTRSDWLDRSRCSTHLLTQRRVS